MSMQPNRGIKWSNRAQPPGELTSHDAESLLYGDEVRRATAVRRSNAIGERRLPASSTRRNSRLVRSANPVRKIGEAIVLFPVVDAVELAQLVKLARVLRRDFDTV